LGRPAAAQRGAGLRACELTFLPMLELMAFLRQSSFKVYIVSGGSVQFMRAFAELGLRRTPSK